MSREFDFGNPIMLVRFSGLETFMVIKRLRISLCTAVFFVRDYTKNHGSKN